MRTSNLVSALGVGWVIAVAAALPSSLQAQSYRATRVAAIDGIVNCHWARDRLITVISGPCEDFVPPKEVRIGATFRANGKTKTINVILADRATKDMPSVGMKAGDWMCSAAESLADIPTAASTGDHTGTWLNIPKCKPLE